MRGADVDNVRIFTYTVDMQEFRIPEFQRDVPYPSAKISDTLINIYAAPHHRYLINKSASLI